MRKTTPSMVDGAPAPPRGAKVYADGIAIRKSTYRVTRETMSRGFDRLFAVATGIGPVEMTALT